MSDQEAERFRAAVVRIVADVLEEFGDDSAYHEAAAECVAQRVCSLYGGVLSETSDGMLLDALDQILAELVRRGQAPAVPYSNLMKTALETLQRSARDDVATARWVIDNAYALGTVVRSLHIGPEEK